MQGSSPQRDALSFPRREISPSRSSRFAELERGLAGELLEALSSGHRGEVQTLWEEKMALCEELSRIVRLLQEEVLPREKHMHYLMDKMHQTFEASTGELHAHLQMNRRDLGEEHRRKQQEMVDPMRAMEGELSRISDMLKRSPVDPEAQAWVASRSTPRRTLSPAGSINRGALSSVQGRPHDSVFKLLDRNRDGTISKAEWNSAMSSARQAWTRHS